jgi:hypothetical protein
MLQYGFNPGTEGKDEKYYRESLSGGQRTEGGGRRTEDRGQRTVGRFVRDVEVSELRVEGLARGDFDLLPLGTWLILGRPQDQRRATSHLV